LFEVDATGITVFEFKRDTTRSIHMDRIAGRFEASQGTVSSDLYEAVFGCWRTDLVR
jgi:hypothetical protein